MPNDTTKQSPGRAAVGPSRDTRIELLEAQLRASVRPCARSQIGEQSLTEDYLQGYGILTFRRVREIITEEYEAVRASTTARIAARSLLAATTCPVLPITADGLAEALRLAGWSVRWNTTARHVEARRGEDGDWLEASGVHLHQMMDACSRDAKMQRGANAPEPWRIASSRLEERLLVVVAARSPFEGIGSPVHQTVDDWAGALVGGGRAMTLTEVLRESGVLNRYESAARAPKSVFADAAAALTARGWSFGSVRTPDGPRKRWTSPGPRGTLPLCSRVRAVDDYKPTTAKVLTLHGIDK